jgi:hypothetical protein
MYTKLTPCYYVSNEVEVKRILELIVLRPSSEFIAVELWTDD